jgi:hypothetical protein
MASPAASQFTEPPRDVATREADTPKRKPRARLGPPGCLDTEGVADELGCSPSLVEKMRRKNSGPPWIRVGMGRGRVVYPRDSLKAWIAARTQGAAASGESEGRRP